MNNLQTGKPEVLVRGLAPLSMNLPGRFFYTIVRLVYLIVTAAALPVALYFMKHTSGALIQVPVVAAWVVAFAACVWILIYVGLEQYNYPVGLTGAVVLTASTLLSGLSGTALSHRDFAYGAYHMLIGGLAAQFIFLVITGIGYSALKIIKHKRGAEIPGFILGFVLFLALALGLLLFIMIRPLWQAFQNEKSIVMLTTAVFFLVTQVISDMRGLWQGSILNPGVMKDPLRNDLHNAWSGLSAVAIIAAVVAAGAIAIW